MPKNDNQRPQRRRPRQARKGAVSRSLTDLFKARKKQNLQDFRPDSSASTWWKTAHMTRQQRLRLTKWALYIAVVVFSLVIQDVIMSQIGLFGATTDLAVCAILMITVIEGTEIGSLFVLIASTLYYFSGTAPGAYCIGLLTFLGIGATLFRQMYWHRSRGSVTFCAAVALAGYEMGLFVVGLAMELTRFDRINMFLLTALYSCLVLIPLYPLIEKIGLIGGNTWKE